uniref:DUF1482 family protein n=1 Tax=Dickeya chrysanthemi TaxID=556 RepID=UPI001CF591FC|nr:YebW family protein [Dickeya chrysanthemi]
MERGKRAHGKGNREKVMGVMFALVIAICSTHGDCEPAVTGVYDSQQECELAMYEERILDGECYPVERIIRQADDQQP